MPFEVLSNIQDYKYDRNKGIHHTIFDTASRRYLQKLSKCFRKTKGHGTKGGNSAKGSHPAGGFFGKVILTDPRLHQRTKRQLVNAPLSGYPLGTMPW